MKTTLTTRHQVSIPKAICDQLELKPGMRIDWNIAGNKLVGYPLPERAWMRLIGSRKQGTNLVDDLLAARSEDRAREDRKMAR